MIRRLENAGLMDAFVAAFFNRIRAEVARQRNNPRFSSAERRECVMIALHFSLGRYTLPARAHTSGTEGVPTECQTREWRQKNRINHGISFVAPPLVAQVNDALALGSTSARDGSTHRQSGME